MAFLKAYQLYIMLFLSGICGILAVMTLLSSSLPRRRKNILAFLELSAMFLLLFDFAAYQLRGADSGFGSFMVRFSNGMVFFLAILIPHMVTQYLKDVCRSEGHLQITPVLLKICDFLFAAGTVLIVISQFTGLYYTFDAQNLYQRSDGYVFSYIVPFLIVLLQELTLILYWSRLEMKFALSLIICIALPTVFSVVQIFHYGISLTNMSMVIMVIVFHQFALRDLNRSVEEARIRELEYYKEAEKKEAALFEQTAESLASAIDAKDKYTHGHSTRVADISRRIAKEAGYSDKDCDQVYFSALLHDVGKIGIPDDIINKTGKLTDEEFAQIKQHPELGYQILSNIKQSPTLSIGAHYHHERYDGKGYPDGLKGTEIPEIARIIAVADAYDAMTSSRSYRGELSPEKTKQELIEGKGKQFDPVFAEILLGLLENEDPII